MIILILFLLALFLAYLFSRLLPYTTLALLITLVIFILVAFGNTGIRPENVPVTCTVMIVGAFIFDIISKFVSAFRPRGRRRYYVED